MEVVVEEDVNATTMEGLVANITKEPQYIIKKSLQFKSGMNVLGMYLLHLKKKKDYNITVSPTC